MYITDSQHDQLPLGLTGQLVGHQQGHGFKSHSS